MLSEFWRSNRASKKPRSGRNSHCRDGDQADIGKYVAKNGNTVAQRRFKSKFPNLSESTIHSFKTKYLAQSAQQGRVSSIPSKSVVGHGHWEQLTEKCKATQHCCKCLVPFISAPLLIAAAEGIIKAGDTCKSLLSEHGGGILLHRSWANSLMINDENGGGGIGEPQCRLSGRSPLMSSRDSNKAIPGADFGGQQHSTHPHHKLGSDTHQHCSHYQLDHGRSGVQQG